MSGIVTSFFMYGMMMIFLAGIAVAGVVAGKSLRQKKDGKQKR